MRTFEVNKALMAKFVSYFLAILICLIILLPFLWMFSTAIKPLNETFQIPPRLIPKVLKLANFALALKRSHGMTAILNSALYVVGCLSAYLIVASLAGFAFAKYSFRGKEMLFVLVLATVMVPIEGIVVPLFIIMKNWGWINTYQGLIIPRIIEPFGIFLLRQHFETIPNDFIDSARMDGSSELGILTRVMMPLSRAVFLVTALFMFLWRWNDLLWPMVIGQNQKMITIQVAISLFHHGDYIEWNLIMAMCVIGTIPGTVLFVLMQKFFIQGVMMSGLKG